MQILVLLGPCGEEHFRRILGRFSWPRMSTWWAQGAQSLMCVPARATARDCWPAPRPACASGKPRIPATSFSEARTMPLPFPLEKGNDILYRCRLKVKNHFHPLPKREKVKIKIHGRKTNKHTRWAVFCFVLSVQGWSWSCGQSKDRAIPPCSQVAPGCWEIAQRLRGSSVAWVVSRAPCLSRISRGREECRDLWARLGLGFLPATRWRGGLVSVWPFPPQGHEDVSSDVCVLGNSGDHVGRRMLCDLSRVLGLCY